MKMNAEDALASISVMRMKEETDYRCEDYITRFAQSHPHETGAVDEVCRTLMAEWCLKVVDRCGFQKDTAAISMNMLDRFLATKQGMPVMKNRNLFQLASMTALYTAIKIHEAEALQPETIVQLSRGIFTVEEIEKMEVQILFAIQWRTNPPTALTFVQHFLETVPHHSERKLIYELAKVQTELAISDFSCVTQNPSSIAYAALHNAIELLDIDSNFLRVLVHLVDVELPVDNLQDRMAMQLAKHIPHVVSSRVGFSNQKKRSGDVVKSTSLSASCGQSSPREVHKV